MTINELLHQQQESGNICLIKQGLFFRAYNQGKFTARLCNRSSYAGYCKIKMQDYTLTSGGRAIDYVEW